MAHRILVVDDEPLKRITLQIELAEHGYEVCEAADAPAAMQLFDTRPFDVVVTDVRMPGTSGLDLLTYVKQARPEVAVILMTAYATIDTAVLAMKRGAYDYITKPFTTPELLEKLARLFAGRAPTPDNEIDTLGQLVARSPVLKRLFEQARALAATDRPILLCGEKGTGKERLAEAIHATSPRAAQPFVRFSCAATDPQSLAGELFGLEKGAAGAAARPKPGRLDQAEGGTLLLDEVAALPTEIQPRLLRLLERQEFERVGGDQPIRANVRVLATTSCDLLASVKDGRFSEDLYYRLGAVSLTIPPLRERPDDIPVLARHMLARQDGRPVELTPHAADELLRHTWPGNGNELEHVLARALALCPVGAGDGNESGAGPRELRAEYLLPLGKDAPSGANPMTAEMGESGRIGLTETVTDIERRMILLALRQCDHNQARAAQRLGIPRTTLRDKMAKYSIPGG
jgi:DNA-binding NtrC family response regulator